MARINLFTMTFLLLSACRPQIGANLAVDDTQVMPPPPSDLRPQSTGFGLGNIPGLGRENGYCTVNKDGSSTCYDGNGNEIPKEKPTPTTSTQPVPEPSNAPTFMDLKVISDDSRRLFTPDKKQFYRPLDGLDGYFQNFNAAGEPTGFYWNKQNNQIFKFDGTKNTGFDATTKKPIFSANSQIFNVKQENGVWRGDQVMQDGSPTGVFYNYGMPMANSSVANADQNYEFKFGIDRNIVSLKNNPAKLNAQFFDLQSEEKILYFDQNPFQVSDFKGLKTYNQSQMSTYWRPPPVQRPIPVVQPGGRISSPQTVQGPSSGRGQVILVTNPDLPPNGCGPCKTLESLLAGNSLARSKITSTTTNYPGVSSIPTLITPSKNIVGPDAIINWLNNN